MSDEGWVVLEVSSLTVVAWLTETKQRLIVDPLLPNGYVRPVTRHRTPPRFSGPDVEISEHEVDLASMGDDVASTEPSSLRLVEEQRRGRIVDGLLVLLGVVVVGVMTLVGLGRATVSEGLQLFSALGGAIVGLLGAAVGHYFARAPSASR